MTRKVGLTSVDCSLLIPMSCCFDLEIEVDDGLAGILLKMLPCLREGRFDLIRSIPLVNNPVIKIIKSIISREYADLIG